MADPTPQQILDVPLDDSASGARTIRGYLVELARQVWIHGEEFSGKRPFGDSGWEQEIYEALHGAGFINAVHNKWGELDCDEDSGDLLILQALYCLQFDAQVASPAEEVD